ncbi:hypothetical protein KBB96_11030 [Luteolibacter ambystomatis]|uniref:Uncharacterized protein n=1 Tax=Luteolibacter ambystomatis TaxID=2824561 RepID=A0A975G6Y0_9BACT|nr:hypothetical protein [Luteolibacter ambystomatis]QUE49405.1 hypothetical protein KBB96_11030 [Luteolibacter ambystomatis]
MTRRLFGFGFLLLLQPLTAQTKPEEGPQVRFLAERVPDNLGEVVIQNGDNKSAPFKLPVNQLSPPIAAAARTFVLKSGDKGQPLCPVTLPETGKSFAVILVLAPPAAYAPIVVRTDDPEFKAGDVFFINRSTQTVLAKLGDTKLALKAGESKKSHPTNPVNNTYYDIAFATQEGEKTKMISTTRWPIDNLLRSYVFFFTTAEGATSFRAVDEYMTPPPQ